MVIGLDGATLDLIEGWALGGHLPVFLKIMNQGIYGKLRSVMPVLSSAAWTSFMTGVNPGKHGIYDFVRRDVDSYRLRPVHRGHIKAPTFWKILGDHGYKVGIINIPMTYPPEEVNGFLVSGLGTPNYRPFTHPPELTKNLRELGYQVNRSIHYQPGHEEKYLAEIRKFAKRQFDVAVKLMKEQPWDLLINVFFDTDQISHFFWHFMDSRHPAHKKTDATYANAILDFYKTLDSYVGELIELAGPDTNVLIVSDHGFGPFYKDVALNEWLRQHGYLTLHGEIPQLNGHRKLLANMGLTRQNISARLRSSGLGFVENWIKEILDDRIELLPRSQQAEFPQAINWSSTRAYSFGFQGQIYINLKGREPQGIVNPGAEYEQTCQQIISELASLTDPDDGKPVIDAIYRKEDLFNGLYRDIAPDLVLVMRNLTYNTRVGYEFGSMPGSIITIPKGYETGGHQLDGVLMAQGPDVLSSGKMDQPASILDIAPTILSLMGIPVPSYMDGKILNDCFATEGSIITQPTTDDDVPIGYETKGYSSNHEEQELIERFKKLGYLE